MDHAVGYMMRLLSSLTEPAIAHSLVGGVLLGGAGVGWGGQPP